MPSLSTIGALCPSVRTLRIGHSANDFAWARIETREITIMAASMLHLEELSIAYTRADNETLLALAQHCPVRLPRIRPYFVLPLPSCYSRAVGCPPGVAIAVGAHPELGSCFATMNISTSLWLYDAT